MGAMRGGREKESNAERPQERVEQAVCKQRLEEFMNGFNTISLKLKEMYQVRSCPS